MTVTPNVIPVTPGSGINLDAAQVVVAGNTVEREIVVAGSPSTPGNYQETTDDSASIIMPVASTQGQLQSAAISFSGSGANVVIAAISGKVVRVYRLFLVVGGATNLTMQDTSASAFSGALPMTANGAITLDFESEPWFTTAAGNGFAMNSSSGVQVSGTVYYTQE